MAQASKSNKGKKKLGIRQETAAPQRPAAQTSYERVISPAPKPDPEAFTTAFGELGMRREDTDFFSIGDIASGVQSSIYNRGQRYGQDVIGALDRNVQNLQTTEEYISSGAWLNDPILTNAYASAFGEDFDPDDATARLLEQVDAQIAEGQRTSAAARARSGDRSALNAPGVDQEETERLLRLAGYDGATVAFDTPEYQQMLETYLGYTRDDLERDLDLISSYRNGQAGISPENSDLMAAAERVSEYTGTDVMTDMERAAGSVRGPARPTFGSRNAAMSGLSDAILSQYDTGYQELATEYNRAVAENGLTPQEKIQLAASGYDPSAEGTGEFDSYLEYLRRGQLQQTQQERVQQQVADVRAELREKYTPDQISAGAAYGPQGWSGYEEIPWHVRWRDTGTNPEMVKAAILAIHDEDLAADLIERYGDNGRAPTVMERYNANTMSQEDQNMFMHLWDTEGQEAAMQYLDDISLLTDMGVSFFTQEANAALADSNLGGALLANAGSLASVYGRAAMLPFNLYRAATGEEISEYDPSFLVGRASNAVLGTTGQNIDEFLNNANIFGWNIGSGVYNAGMSAIESWMMAPFGAWGGSLFLGSTAGNDAMMSALESGRSTRDAAIDGFAAAAIETAFEHSSLEKLFGDVGNPWRNLLTQGMTEGLEEFGTEAASIVLDTMRYGDTSELAVLYNSMLAMGYGETAATEVVKHVAGQLRDAWAGGFVGGVMGGGVSSASTAINDYRTGRGIIDAESVSGLLDVAETLNLPEDVRRLVEDQRRAERALSASLPAPNAAAQAGMEQAVEEAETSQDVADAAVEAVQAQAPSVSAQAAMPEQAQLPGSDSLTQAAQQPIEQQEQQQNGTEAPAVTAEAVTAEPTAETEADQESREWMEYIESQQTQAQETAQEIEAEPVTPDANQVREVEQEAETPAAAKEQIQPTETQQQENEAEPVTPDANQVHEAEQEAETPAAATEQIQPTETQQQENGKPPKISAAKVGRIYREVMKQLDADAQAVVVENLNRYVQNMLIENGYDGDRTNVRVLADKILRLSAGRQNVSDLEMQDIENNRAARAVVSDLTARVAEKYRIRGLQAELAGMANTQAPVTGKAAQRYLKSAAEGFSQAEADVMQRNYIEGQDAVSYAQQFRTAYEYGQDGRNLENMKGSSTFRTLNEAQLGMAYELGRAARNSAQQAAPKSVGMRVGNVDTTAIRGMRLNTAQNASVNFMSRLAKTAGFNVRFVATSANAQGQFTEENGSYDKTTRTITIDVNAGRLNTSSFNYAMIHTAGHELTHFIKEFGDANLYKAYQEFVFGHLSVKMTEAKLNRRIAQIIAANKKLGKELSREEAIDEVVADASADVLSKMTEQDMQELAEQNPSLLKRIKNFIQRWVKSMKALLKTALSGQQTSNELAKQMEDVIDEQYAAWMKLFKSATENARKADAEAAVEAVGIEISESGDTAFVESQEKEQSGDVQYQARVNGKDTVYKYTRSQYNSFAWATDNGILSPDEVDQIESINGSRKHGGRANEAKSADGFVVVEIGKSGKVHDIVVVTGKKFGSPNIRRVYRINSEYEMVIEIIREDIYKYEKACGRDAIENVRRVYSNELVEPYDREDYLDLYDPSTGRSRRARISGGEVDQETGELHNRDGSAENAGRDGAVGDVQLEALVPDVREYTEGDEAQRLDLLNAREDLMFQTRDPSQITDREILANAMDEMATTKTELDWVQRYRKNIGELNEKQRQMDEINADIVRMSNEDPKGNRDEIIRQQNRAKILASQIDRYDKRLLEFEAGKPLKAVVERERTKLKDKAKADLRKYAETTREAAKQREAEQREKYQAILSDVRSKRDEALSKLRKEKNAKIEELRSEKNAKIAELQREKTEAVKKVREEKNESFSRQKYLERVQKDSATLREWLTHPTNKAHVPEFLRKPLGDLLNELDFSSARSLKGGDATQSDERMIAAMRALHEALRKARGEDAQQFAGYIDLPVEFLDEFNALTTKVEQTLKAGRDANVAPINRMTSAQLKAVSDAIRTLNTSIRQMNRLLANARFQRASDAAQSTINEMDNIRDKTSRIKALESIGDFLNWKNTTPFYAFKRFGEGGKAIFEGLMRGWDKLAFNSKAAIDYANATYTAKEAKNWSKEVHDVELNGRSVRMTTTQIMSLYCLSRRAQARQHLLGGGIRVGEIDTRGKRIRQARNHMLTEADIDRITDVLSARQIEVANQLQQYMSSTCAEWGNEVSMKRFGYNAFTEDFYFPIETDANNRKQDDTQAKEQDLFRLLNLSPTKGLVQGANNAVVISDIFDVFAAHTSDMAKYNALALPVLDMIKWLNYNARVNSEGMPYNPQEDGQAFDTVGTRKSIENAFGSVANKYVMDFLRDLNGSNDTGRNDGMLNKLISRSKIASVGANLRVYALQMTSLPRAGYAINGKYLAKALAKSPAHLRTCMRDVQKNVGIAQWKALGFYDTNISRSVRSMIKHDDTAVAKLREWSMTPAGFMDNMTMGIIYDAVREEMKDKHPTIKAGTQEYNDIVNVRMSEIVYMTQVVDSTMTRSDLMRSKGVATLTTAFMSEPTLTMNMFNDSLFEMATNKRRNEKADWRKPTAALLNASALIAFSGTLAAVVQSLFSAYRDDDEFETFGEKFWDAFIGDYSGDMTGWEKFKTFVFSNLGSNLNLLNNIPFISDLMNKFAGYDDEVMWMAAVNDFQSAWKAYQNFRNGAGGQTAYTWIYYGLSGTSNLVGLPISNAAREVSSAWNTFFADRTGKIRLQTYRNTATEGAEAFYAALAAGDEEMAQFYLERADISGAGSDKVRDKLRDMIKADFTSGELDEETAVDWLMQHAGRTEEEAAEDIDRWRYTMATGSSDGYSVYWEMYDAFENGGDFATIAQRFIAGGKSKSSMASAISRRYKNDYLAIEGTPEGASMLERILDLYEAIGYDRDYERRYIDENWVYEA